MNKGFAVLLNSFQLVNRNVNPVILKNGDGKNSLFVIQGTITFPQSRLSSHNEKKMKFFFSIPSKPLMGKYDCTLNDE